MQDEISQVQPFDAHARIFKVLAHPARIAILEILRDGGERCVCHMQAYLGFRQVYISQQLAVLRDAGLVQDRRDGWNIYYHVTDSRIYDVLSAVQRITGHSSLELKNPRVTCNCPRCSSHAARGLK